jgi:hypothetical protein
MARRAQTPQEKKRLDYERQRRGGAYNSVGAARTGVPRKKRRQARLERQAVSNALPRMGAPEDVIDQFDRAEARISQYRGIRGLKSPGMTLRQWVDRQLGRREEHERRAIRPQDLRPSPERWRPPRYCLHPLIIEGRVMYTWSTVDGSPLPKRVRRVYGDRLVEISAPAATAPARCPACPATGSRSDPGRP